MRVYVPATLALLRTWLDAGEVGPAPFVAHAVTPALREWYVEGDLEELEYAATTAAARDSLRLLAGGPQGDEPVRRLVLAADVPDAAARPDPGHDRSAVTVSSPVPLRHVVSAHVDDADAEPAVRAALAALAAADAGDEDARWTVEAVEDHELLWYAAQELASVPGLA